MLDLPSTCARQPRLTTVSRGVTHAIRSVPLLPRPAEVCSIYWIGTIGQNRNSYLLPTPRVDYNQIYPYWKSLLWIEYWDDTITVISCQIRFIRKYQIYMICKHKSTKLNDTKYCYTRMLWAILNKTGRQHPTKQQLYGHLPPITKTIKVRRTRHAGHYWRGRNEFISDVLLWTPSHGRAKAGRPARTFIQQLCVDTGCNSEDLPEAMNDRERRRERVRDIRADGTTRWWWWWSIAMNH